MTLNESSRYRNKNRKQNPPRQNRQIGDVLTKPKKKYYLLTWSRPNSIEFMGCVVDGNGNLLVTISSLFFGGGPSKEFIAKCKTYNIQGKMSGNYADQFVIKGSFNSPRQAVDIFKTEIKPHLG